MRLALLVLLSYYIAPLVYGQTPYESALVERAREATHDRKDKLRAFRIKPDVGAPYQVQIPDSLTYGTHRLVAPEGRSIGVAYTGNANSPWLSHIFFDRESQEQDFVFLAGFQGMRFAPERATFYDTRTPFTYIHYRTNYDDTFLEEVITGTLSFNLGKRLNLGASVDHVGALGYYESGHSRNTNYRLFGSYRSDRYDLWLSLGNDDLRQNESAGIANLDYILHPDRYTSGRIRITSKDVPVHLPGNLLYNRLTSGHTFVSHRYKLGHKRTIQVVDSVVREASGAGLPPGAIMDESRIGRGRPSPSRPIKEAVLRDSTIFVPVGSISHQLSYGKHTRLMRSGVADERWLTFFGEPQRNITRTTDQTTGTETISVLPYDQVRLETLRNTLSLSLVEGFRPWVKAGLSAYLRTENNWVYRPDEADATRLVRTDKLFSAFAGAELSRTTGRGLNFALRGELGVLGHDIGAIKLEGNLETSVRLMGRDFALKADGNLYNMRPSYLAAHHQGTWGGWDKDFSFVRRLDLGARLDLTSWGTWAELRTASLQNHLYWTRTGEAMQHNSLVQTTMLRLGHRYQVGALGWRLEGAYQLSTDEAIVPLPMLTAHADLFLDFYIAGVLRSQIGVEGYWHSSYYAPYYHPAVMQFVQQSEAKVGGKAPLLSAYASFRHKNTRFYFKMFNVGEAFFSTDRQTMYSYVHNPMGLQIGLVVDLKN